MKNLHSLQESKNILINAGLAPCFLDDETIILIANKWVNGIKLLSEDIERLMKSIPNFFRNPKDNKLICNWKISTYSRWMELGLYEYVSRNDDVDFYCSFMGAYETAKWVDGIEVLAHGTSSCVSSYNISRPSLAVDGIFPKHYSTNLDNNDVIFGCNQKLIQCIREIYKRKSPKILIIVTTCITDIIGENLEEAIDACRDLPMKIIPITAGGCSGKDFREGSNLVFKALFDAIPRKNAKNSLNLILYPFRDNKTQELEKNELASLLTKAGIELNTVLERRISFESLCNSPSASASIGICPTKSQQLSEILSEKYGQKPVISLPPIGFKAVKEWLLNAVKAMGITNIHVRNMDILKIMEKEAYEFVEKNNLSRRRVVVFLPPGRAFPIARFFHHLGMRPMIMAIKPFQFKTLSKIVKGILNSGEDFDIFMSGFGDLIKFLRSNGDENAIIVCRKKLEIFRHFVQVCIDPFRQLMYGINGQAEIFKRFEKAIEDYDSPDFYIFDKFYPEDSLSCDGMFHPKENYSKMEQYNEYDSDSLSF